MATAPNTMLSDAEIEAALAEIESGAAIPSLDDDAQNAPAATEMVVPIPVNAGRAPLGPGASSPAAGLAIEAPTPAVATDAVDADMAAACPDELVDPDADLLAEDGGVPAEPTWHWWTPFYATADTLLDLVNLPFAWLPQVPRRVLGQVAALTLVFGVTFAALGPMLRSKNTPLDYLAERKAAVLAPPPPPAPAKAEGGKSEGGGHGGAKSAEDAKPKSGH
jgi:hypothetical protein